MTDPLALSKLLRATGLSALAIQQRLDTAPNPVPVSSQSVGAWLRGSGKPRDAIRGRVADALGIPRRVLYAACSGEDALLAEPDGLRDRLLDLVADGETPIELCYHPDADPGNGAGWSIMVGDLIMYGTLDGVMEKAR